LYSAGVVPAGDGSKTGAQDLSPEGASGERRLREERMRNLFRSAAGSEAADGTDAAKAKATLTVPSTGYNAKSGGHEQRGKRAGYRDMRPTDTLRFTEGAHVANAATERSRRVRDRGV